jgi:hypothetical protein
MAFQRYRSIWAVLDLDWTISNWMEYRMTDLVNKSVIENIVGAERNGTRHLARAVSENQTVYILHSYDCLGKYAQDLRLCPFSLALDKGIDLTAYVEDQVALAKISKYDGKLALFEWKPNANS